MSKSEICPNFNRVDELEKNGGEVVHEEKLHQLILELCQKHPWNSLIKFLKG